MINKNRNLFIQVLVITFFIGMLGYITYNVRGRFRNVSQETESNQGETADIKTFAEYSPVLISSGSLGTNAPKVKSTYVSMDVIRNILKNTGLYAFIFQKEAIDVPSDVRIVPFEREVIDKLHHIEDVEFLLSVYEKGDKNATLHLKKGISETEVNRIRDLLIRTGFIKTASDGSYKGKYVYGWQKLVMILIGLVLLYLGVSKGFEPLLLVPIGFGTILVNVPFAGLGEQHGMLRIIFEAGIENEFFPLIIFMGVGALTDFGPLIANPKMALLGAAAQFGIFGSLIGAIALNLVPGIEFSLQEAGAIAIIGGADGPTAIFTASKLAPHLLGSIAVAAYSYMALVPLIQPPIMTLLTTKKERMIKMEQLRHVGRTEKIVFPLIALSLCILFLPSAVPLIGALCFGNFAKESGVVERISKILQNQLLDIITVFLGLGVGMQMAAHKFMQPSTMGILAIGLVAFSFGTAAGIFFAKLLNLFTKKPINPLIGSAGVSAVPMAARVANKVGMDADPSNFLLMHAMGPNVSGVIGSAIAAGVMISLFF